MRTDTPLRSKLAGLFAFAAACCFCAAEPAQPTTQPVRAGSDWWSLQPLKVTETSTTVGENPIDSFVAARLRDQHLTLSAPADRRTLIRRLSFDLIGLPPTPAEVDAFVADPEPKAYERLVDRLLASPHYGERWARHWLDVARFGESNGFERDQLRPNAWRYRDWVVKAFNDDLPYDQFARLQIAGDLVEPSQPDGIIATGFLVGGAYDEVGHSQQSAAMRAVVRQDEMEDLVGTTAQTFLGLTANCARCHDHKFDPIHQAEYYRLASALAGIQQAERPLPADTLHDANDALAQRATPRIEELRRRIETTDRPVRDRLTARNVQLADARKNQPLPKPIARWDFSTDLNDQAGALNGVARGQAGISNAHLQLDGDHDYVLTAPLTRDITAKTICAFVSLKDLKQRGGAVISLQTLDGSAFDAIVFGEREPGHWMAGSESFRRTQPFEGPAETEADRRPVHVALVYGGDGSLTFYRNGRLYGHPFKTSGVVPFKAGQSQISFGLRHLPELPGKYLSGAISHAALFDRALSAEEVARVAQADPAPPSDAEIAAALTPDQRTRREQWKIELDQLSSQRGRALANVTYAVVPSAAPVVHVLKRGNPADELQVVAPGGIAAVQGVSAEFGLASDAPESQRRLKLAQWITDPHNPLFSRVIVNRLWQYHFGTGIVETPNDFGFNGGRPSHPELLDYLASRLIEHGWSLKQLQRLIVTSATYRQASQMNPAAAKLDSSDRLLWRFPPRRLEAEELHDTLLAVAGELNLEIGGPGFADYYTFTNNTTFYEARDYVGSTFNRRSLYRTWVRSGRNPVLDVFDCPDPSTRAPHRIATVTPLQALALENDSFVLRMADLLADRLSREAGPRPQEQVALALRLGFGRAPADDELRTATEFISHHSLSAFCRVLFNSNEFIYVD